jgi:glutamate synthase (NADPH/NADH) small chain
MSDLKLTSKYAWRDIPRQTLPRRPAAERVADFLEVAGLYDEQTVREQASRCVQCPDPTCVQGCPLCNPIPEWLRLAADGRFLEAADVLGAATNLPEICARTCPTERLCEGECLLHDPVSIRSIEHFLVEYAIAHGKAESNVRPPNGLKVAVVGAGIGGLACADELAKMGYAATVFDSAATAGGLLLQGLAPFKLDRYVLERRMEILRRRGVAFQLGAGLWTDVTLNQLRAGFDAVYLGFDSRKARALAIPGSNLPGVVQALAFILQGSDPNETDAPPIEVTGQRVVVIGGGDTAMECLRTAIRRGAASVAGVYRREESDLPCSRAEFEEALEEGAKFRFCAAPVALAGTDRVARLRCLRTQPLRPEEQPPRQFEPVPGTEFEIEADCVVTALGFDPLPCPRAGDWSELAVNERGGVIVDAKQQTSIPRVFAGGDIVRGPLTLLESVREARSAAASIDGCLSAGRRF